MGDRMLVTERAGLLEKARELARTGRYASANGVLDHLAMSEDLGIVADWLSDPCFRAQLNVTCVLARGATPPH